MTSYAHGQPPFHNGLISQAGRKRRTSDEFPPGLAEYVPFLPSGPDLTNRSVQDRLGQIPWLHAAQQLLQLGVHQAKELRSWRPRQLLSLPLALIIVWGFTLWWGEEAVFRHNVEECVWKSWETWPASAAPHHVVFVADPQLVDPHTYPGRPWPLSTLTVRYTDLYMRKSFQKIQNLLDPDTVFFLGDLFDGGREWSTFTGDDNEKESPDKRWRSYDSKFWLKEYKRFARIFFEPWLRGSAGSGGARPGRKLVASLPGNHDLGLGGGIRIPVRKRFQAYFGDGSRFDLVGNHSFVSLDTVSLSAKGQVDAAPVSQEAVSDRHKKDVWRPVDDFLRSAKTEKARFIERELRVRDKRSENELLDHTTLELDNLTAYKDPPDPEMNHDIPSVILTHVPLYRAEGTRCGPLRERFPPAGSAKENDEGRIKDNANSIKIQQGLQYQNVLTPAISNEIIDSVGSVTHVFSGDDHDYCDLIHRGYTSKSGGIREITVKSISWAMGVRHPGIVLASLWNPIDADGHALSQEGAKTATIQTHLCLLPDQLSIFIKYGFLLAFTLCSLLLRACRIASIQSAFTRKLDGSSFSYSKPSVSCGKAQKLVPTSARNRTNSQLSVRPSAGKSRSLSPANGYGHGLSVEEASSDRHDDRRQGPSNGLPDAESQDDSSIMQYPRRKRIVLFASAVRDDLRSSIVRVATTVLCWYVWLLWSS